ncbi:hypothetical protein FQR65_LT20537 [Abscondita terminalis]|nr:hypothetical protein FQR65_LT20537 [Abscondita terminalis]
MTKGNYTKLIAGLCSENGLTILRQLQTAWHGRTASWNGETFPRPIALRLERNITIPAAPDVLICCGFTPVGITYVQPTLSDNQVTSRPRMPTQRVLHSGEGVRVSTALRDHLQDTRTAASAANYTFGSGITPKVPAFMGRHQNNGRRNASTQAPGPL